MNAVVIGGAGFIGSHLVDRLLAEGATVDVVDDLSTGSLANLADARLVSQHGDGELKIHNVDARSADFGSLLAMRRPDVVYHLALLPRPFAGAIGAAQAFESAVMLVDAARLAGVAKVVVALPASVLHGHPAARDIPVKEDTLVPRGVRGVAAHAIIELLTVAREHDALEFTALACATVYGPRQRADGGVVAALHDAAVNGRPPRFDGGGRQSRDLVFVDDVVDAMVRAADRGSGLVINVGTGVMTTVTDLWKRLGGTGDPVLAPARPDDLHRFAVSPVRARIHLAWSPWTDLDTGIARLAAGR